MALENTWTFTKTAAFVSTVSVFHSGFYEKHRTVVLSFSKSLREGMDWADLQKEMSVFDATSARDSSKLAKSLRGKDARTGHLKVVATDQTITLLTTYTIQYPPNWQGMFNVDQAKAILRDWHPAFH